MLVHVWGAVRPNTSDSGNSYNQFTDSPFCVDVFAPQLNARKRWGWHLVTSAAYVDASAPGAVEMHWLQPALKQGPIVEIISGNGAPGISTEHTLFVWDKGFQGGYDALTPQRFESGGSGGGDISQRFDQVDERGTMVVTSVDSFGGKTHSITRYRWDGERFVAAAAK